MRASYEQVLAIFPMDSELVVFEVQSVAQQNLKKFPIFLQQKQGNNKIIRMATTRAQILMMRVACTLRCNKDVLPSTSVTSASAFGVSLVAPPPIVAVCHPQLAS